MTDAITADGVEFAYGRVTAVERSSFTIPRGAITAIIGPNGSGKSTLLNGIAGLADPVGGTLRVVPVEGRAAKVAYVLQTTKVNESLPITVQEVVAMGRYAGTGAYGWLRTKDRNAIEAAMARTGISEFARKHLHDLSGGQRQRVFLAQGIAQDHDVLLLDEPLTGLDITSARAIDEVIHGEHALGCTVVVTTHDLAEAGVADYVLLLSGRVVASGTPADVLTVANLTEAYGPTLLHVEDHRLFIDDPAHRPVGRRHVHRERTIHVEAPGEDLHGT